ncbi:MAG: lipoyl(octanoyl) transferase LipB [bacterium]|nr:lipoyl(octanoyl) transferase LipB [bacterium]
MTTSREPIPAQLIISPALISYQDAYEEQMKLLKQRQAGEIPDTVWLLEHFPVYTYGRSTKVDGVTVSNIVWSEAKRKAAGIELYETDRGGDVTYHGPGQIVGYFIVDLEQHGKDIHRFLRMLEQAVIDTLAHWQLEGYRVEGRTGVWVRGAKVCAMGIRVSRWVTMHGIAFNVNPNLSHFQGIVPCGINDAPVTSLSLSLGREVAMLEARDVLVKSCIEQFHWQI